MSEKSLAEIQKAIEARLLVELELSEGPADFVSIQVNTGRSLHHFLIPKQEDVAQLIIHYMDSQSTLRGEAEAIEQLWNQLAFEHRVMTDFVYGWPQGLQVYADFRYSDLQSESAWETALREVGLDLVETRHAERPNCRHVILAKDSVLA